VLLLDCVRVVFIFTVFLITTRVYLFSFNYIEEEKFFDRFHLILFSFVASMVLLILSPRLLSALIG
jgi:NADH:ubiquinone oxidoreductase subunit 5 (subunit L)/multisubunit Na+/H+ antiporter MnhA subunit